MELQLALDFISDARGMEVAESVKDLIDVVELGTPFVFTYPLGHIGLFKKALPGVRILADYKIMDGGALIAKMAFDAGADIVTVSARTWDGTIAEVVAAARAAGGKTLVDLMGVPENEIATRGREVAALGADYLCVHRAVSVATSGDATRPVQILRGSVPDANIAVAGGIDVNVLETLLPHRPDLVIVGNSVANAANPREVALALRKLMGDKK